jgi:hypothetical protein
MPRKIPRVNPLQLQKELLVAESEINRARLIQDWHAMTVGLHTLTARVKSVSSIASAAALLMAGVSAFQRERASLRATKSSWLQMAVKGAEVAASMWLAFRARSR